MSVSFGGIGPSGYTYMQGSALHSSMILLFVYFIVLAKDLGKINAHVYNVQYVLCCRNGSKLARIQLLSLVLFVVFCALHDQLASLDRHVQLTRCFSAIAEHLVCFLLTHKDMCGGGVTQEHKKSAISQKRCKIGPRLLWRTNKKLHTHFRLVPKSTTLDDLERHIQGLPTVFKYPQLSHERLKLRASNFVCTFMRLSTTKAH